MAIFLQSLKEGRKVFVLSHSQFYFASLMGLIEVLATFQIAEKLARKLFPKAKPMDNQFVYWMGSGPQQPIGIYSSL